MSEVKLNTACTIVSASYIPFARVLAKSFKQNHPESSFYVFLIDEPPPEIDLNGEEYEVVPIGHLGVSNLDFLLFKYNVIEASTAVKPFVLEYLLNMNEGAKIIFLDPDIFVFRQMQEVSEALDVSDIILIPHIMSPYEDDYTPTELDFLKVGAYNLGFIAIKDSENVRRFLSWWKRRLVTHSYATPNAGVFTDQKWMDLVPGLFEKVFFIRHAGYNVAYWNLHERLVSKLDHKYMVNGDTDLVFYHFSGFDVRSPHSLSKYQDRFDLSARPDIEPLAKMYASEVEVAGFDKLSQAPYAFNFYSNSVKIGQFARRLYGALGDEAERFGNPFVVDRGNSFYELLRKKALLEHTRPGMGRRVSGPNPIAQKRLTQEFLIETFFRLLRRTLGVRRYARLLPFLSKMCLDRNQAFLLDNWLSKTLRDDRSK